MAKKKRLNLSKWGKEIEKKKLELFRCDYRFAHRIVYNLK